MQVPSAEEKTGSALLLSRLMRQALHGPRVALLLSRLLPPGLITAIHVRSVPLPALCLQCVCQGYYTLLREADWRRLNKHSSSHIAEMSEQNPAFRPKSDLEICSNISEYGG